MHIYVRRTGGGMWGKKKPLRQCRNAERYCVMANFPYWTLIAFHGYKMHFKWWREWLTSNAVFNRYQRMQSRLITFFFKKSNVFSWKDEHLSETESYLQTPVVYFNEKRSKKGNEMGQWGDFSRSHGDFFFFLASGISSLHCFPWTFLLVTFRSTSNARSCPQLPPGLWASQAASTAAAPADGVYLNRQGESICVCVVLKFLGQHLQKAAYSVNYLHEVF